MKKREEVYEFIVVFMMEHQYAPSVREICEGVNLKSTSSVLAHMEKLKEVGMINYNPSSPRTVTLTGYQLMKVNDSVKAPD